MKQKNTTEKQPLPESPALEELCAAVHDLCQQVRTSTAPEECLHEALEQINQVRQKLAPHVYTGTVSQHFLSNRWGFEKNPLALKDAAQLMCFSPYIGHRNPVSPRFRIQIDQPGQKVSGSGVFPPTSAGPPGCAHGGEIAGLFDELLAAVNWSDHAGGFTGTLTIRYVRLTPLNLPLELRAECIERSGRKTRVRGEMLYQGETTASAEAIFIRPAQTMDSAQRSAAERQSSA